MVPGARNVGALLPGHWHRSAAATQPVLGLPGVQLLAQPATSTTLSRVTCMTCQVSGVTCDEVPPDGALVDVLRLPGGRVHGAGGRGGQRPALDGGDGGARQHRGDTLPCNTSSSHSHSFIVHSVCREAWIVLLSSE